MCDAALLIVTNSSPLLGPVAWDQFLRTAVASESHLPCPPLLSPLNPSTSIPQGRPPGLLAPMTRLVLTEANHEVAEVGPMARSTTDLKKFRPS